VVVKTPEVSVIIPTHNARATLGAALASLQQQTLEDWEAVIVDDGSSDDSHLIAEAYRDPRITLVRQRQSGAAAARNAGLGMARGRFLAFLDADDFLFPDYLRRSLSLLENKRRCIVTNNAFFLYGDGINLRSVRHRYGFPTSLEKQQTALLSSNFVSIMSVFPRDLLDEVPGFDETLDRAEDWDFWLRASFSGWTYLHQRRPMAMVNRAHESLTTAIERVADAEAEIIRKALRDLPLTSGQASMVYRRLRHGEPSLLIAQATGLAISGEYSKAARLHWTATRLSGAPLPAQARAAVFRMAPWFVGRLRYRNIYSETNSS
jgi:glycosyltransferase involved in cell wall biosynthesis